MTPRETPPETTAVTLRACAKTFPDGTRALRPIDLEVTGGETVVFLGPSGCGKTTLLRLIAGLERPDPGGRVLFNGEDVTARPIEKRNVGMVFQSYALFPNMTVRDNIAYGLKVRRVARAEIDARVTEMMDMMHIGDLAARRVDQLSGGQRQRVALARAIAVRPRVLLLDEPLTALDALLRERLRVEIDGLLRRLGITAIYVTHDQAEAMALGDRIVVMSHGAIAQIGPPREIYHRPVNAFVADFIGTINRVPCAGSDGDPELVFRPEDADIVAPHEADFSGTVTAAFFLGDRTRLILAGPGETPVVLDTRERTAFDHGQSVAVRVRPDVRMDLAAMAEAGTAP
ncbi:ABC transporter ATP-binding protein [Rhodospira trueperi]|uniref:Putative spermidine/putrescine transport system ATP-binding protein n=1 Tax=Rhodospira trueperi TaxID=69960 RepID=A0A1G7AMS0_9PROT|nr:ABC transporter ATP-binding protein [Rhodospira trueperi]SDE16092.1 putative spermidine/putrescine transport system ATP-binding protein [Rhodospira trueperi]